MPGGGLEGWGVGTVLLLLLNPWPSPSQGLGFTTEDMGRLTECARALEGRKVRRAGAGPRPRAKG